MNDLPEAPPKYFCKECGKVCSELLEAPHPFQHPGRVHGCAHCGSLDIVQACQAPGCMREATCGVPDVMGYWYAWLCGEHWREVM
jgi:hypothetical protein